MPNYAFTVTVRDNGGVSLTPLEVDENGEAFAQTATVYDILDASRKIVADLERQILSDGFQQVVSALVPADEPTTADVVKEALAKRASETPAPEDAPSK
jgi:hypothetical protein